MSAATLPYLLEPDTLANHLDDDCIRIVCLGKREQYLAAHIPGAVYLDISMLNRGSKPAAGLLPDIDVIEQTFQNVGLTKSLHVVCYDDEAGTRAARMMWVLEAMGHHNQSYLNGGLTAWAAQHLPLRKGAESVMASDWIARPNSSVIASKRYVLESLEDPNTQILDARTPEEHHGMKSASARRGRIPGSVNLNWLDTIDTDNHRKLKSPDELNHLLKQRGFDRNKEIIAHCQTHQRSSHSFMMLRSLGFNNVKGYAGSWSEWADDPALPIE
ncbi:MAG: sulfurtransferase [Arenicellales bacterium]